MSKVTRADMGPYLCIASNGIPSPVSKRIMVHVHCKHDTKTKYYKLRNRLTVVYNEFKTYNIIIFLVHPLINVQHQIVSSRTGATIVLPCDVEASPRSVNYWTMTRGDAEIGNV